MKPKRTTVADLKPNTVFRLYREGHRGIPYVHKDKYLGHVDPKTNTTHNFHPQTHVVVIGYLKETK